MSHVDPTDRTLELYALGELPPDQLTATRRAIEADPDVRARLEALEASNAAILDRYPPDWFARTVRAKADVQTAPNRAPWWVIAPVLAMAATGLWFVPSAPEGTVLPETQDMIREKGDPRVIVYRKGSSDPVRRGDEAQAGDQLQLSVLANGAAWGAVLSLDGRGTVTFHLPERGTAAAQLEAGTVPLPRSYELDDAPDFERFFFVTSDAPFDAAGVASALEALSRSGDPVHGTPALAEGLAVHTVYVEKVGVAKVSP